MIIISRTESKQKRRYHKKELLQNDFILQKLLFDLYESGMPQTAKRPPLRAATSAENAEAVLSETPLPQMQGKP